MSFPSNVKGTKRLGSLPTLAPSSRNFVSFVKSALIQRAWATSIGTLYENIRITEQILTRENYGLNFLNPANEAPTLGTSDSNLFLEAARQVSLS